MKKVYEGKTKNVYLLDDGNCLLEFKDDVTGENGVFDPGANKVALSIEGMGRSGVRMTKFFYEKIEAAGIATHFVSADVEKATMVVKSATLFGSGIEVVCRNKATGSFIKRYGAYAKEGQDLDALVEITLKDDDRNDPLITKDALSTLGILTGEEYEQLKSMAKSVCKIVTDEFAKKGAQLYDIKFEFGRVDGKVRLIDEISAGCMRVYKDGNKLAPLDIGNVIFG